MKRILLGSVLALGLLAWTNQVWADGKALYGTCVSCHGTNGEGNKVFNAPAIAGQEAWYLERQLKNFKAGIRGAHSKDIYGMQMRPMSMTLANDKAIQDIAAYVAGMPKVAAKPSGIGDAKAGQAGYAVCASCHGPKGQGNKALNAPGLAGQHDWYLARQINNFKSGVRGTHQGDTYGAQMRPMAMTLATEKMVNDVSAYITTLK